MKTATGKYRFFLIILLAIAVSGGIWYCYHVNKEAKEPKDGILVQMKEDMPSELYRVVNGQEWV